MKKIALLLLLTTTIYAQSIFLDNQTPYPTKQSKIAIQWAYSAKEVDDDNKALMSGKKLSQERLQPISQKGKVELPIPRKASQFRVLVWVDGSQNPDYTTNWIDITLNKTYTLETDYLIPVLLMPGSGC